MFLKRLTFIVALVLLGSNCGSSNEDGVATPRLLRVDTTVAPVTDIVRQVVGDRVELVELIPAGVDSHTFEPSPSTAKALSRADVLFVAGLHLEDSTLEQGHANLPEPVVIPEAPEDGLGPGARGSEIIQLGDMTLAPSEYAFDATFPRSGGDANPHLWMDPPYAKRWSEIIRDVMARRDPNNAGYYAINQARFAGAIDQLDTAVATSINTIPAAKRKLLTYHDSFAYFARHYGMEVIGAVQPSDFSEPSPKDVRDLVAQVQATNVPAIFGSEVFPSRVLEEVGRSSGVRYVDKLRDDVLPGGPTDPGHTYVGLIVDNVRTIVSALGGDPSALGSVPTAKTWQA
ncbi:MAG TPA: metal ABC transporter substrate-binding protein [Acidimicrobiales bacterium]|nr:metal ABC transporter substrate-binding protein [Acidimicrobiales bacterium]